MRRLVLVVASLLLVTLLAACATTNTNGGNNGGGGNEPPPGAFTISVAPNPVTVVRDDPNGGTITVTVTFDANYDDAVQVRSSVLPQGVTIRFGGIDINQVPPRMTESGSVDLQVYADASAIVGDNNFTQIHGQGCLVSNSGGCSDRGKPQRLQNLGIDVQ